MNWCQRRSGDLEHFVPEHWKYHNRAGTLDREKDVTP